MEKYQYPLKDEFIEFCNTSVKYKGKLFEKINSDSAKCYAEDYLPGLRKYLYSIKSYSFEKDFLDVIPYLLSLGKLEECTQVLLRVYRAVQIEAYSGGKILENRRSAFNKYALFIQHEYIDNHKQVLSAITLPNNLSLNTILSALNNVKVYFYVKHNDILSANGLTLNIKNYNLWRILKNRLGSQNRTSGNKTWFSVKLIKALDKSKTFNGYADNINENTYIHAVDNNGLQIPIRCRDVWCLYLYKTSVQSNYHLKVTTKKNYKTYDVLTPTATLGTRIPMSVKGIQDVVIDHVKPIDQSLRELDAKGKIPELVKLSDAYKTAKNILAVTLGSKIKVSDIVNKAISLLGSTVNTAKLQTELDLLLNDSWYRLMETNQNSAKSNNNLFSEFWTNNASTPSVHTIIGKIMEVKHPTNGTVMWVYQELSNPGTNYVNDASIVKSTYPTQIYLTSFTSVWGPEIL